jgi:ComF family protein
MTFRDLANALLSALIAPPCGTCGSVLDQPLDGAVCDRCWAAIRPCRSSFSLPSIARAQAMGPYEGALRDVLHALKYDGRRSIAPYLSRMMATHARDLLADAHLVVAVPLHRRRFGERGFNQAEDLARGLGVPMARVLRRVKATRPQVGLSADERHDNVRDAFALGPSAFAFTRRSRRIRQAVQGGTIVLVDDIATTGATLEACARVLMAAGAAEVRAITAARAASGRRHTLRA